MLLLVSNVSSEGEAEGEAEAVRDRFTNGHRQTLIGSDQDITALLRQASNEDLLLLRDQAEALRQEKFQQHETLLRQLERRQEAPAPAPPVTASQSRTPTSLTVKSLSNQLALDLFFNTRLSHAKTETPLEVQPIFSIPRSSPVKSSTQSSTQSSIQSSLLSDRMKALFEAIENRSKGGEPTQAFSPDNFRFRFADADIRVGSEGNKEVRNSSLQQSKEEPESNGRPAVRFVKPSVESDEFRLNAKINTERTLSDLLALKATSKRVLEGGLASFASSTEPTSSQTELQTDLQTDLHFPNFPHTESFSSHSEERNTETTTRRNIKRPPKPRIRKINREELAEDEDEKERRRQEAGLKRRKELFEATRKRKLLDSKKRRLFERKRVEKPRTTTESSVTTRHLDPVTTTLAPTTDTLHAEQSQERVVDEALKAVLGRAVQGNIQDSPLVWAAIGAIYEFVEMQEKTKNEQVPSQILSALGQLTKFLNKNQNDDTDETEDKTLLESLNVDTVKTFNKLRLTQRKLIAKEPSTTRKAPIDYFEDDKFYDDNIFYDDESLNDNDYIQYESQEEKFRFSFNQQPKFPTTLKPKPIPERKSTQTPTRETSTVFLDTPFRLQLDPQSGLYSTVLDN